MCFMHVQDRYGLIQLVINKNDLGEEPYELVKASDGGDYHKCLEYHDDFTSIGGENREMVEDEY